MQELVMSFGSDYANKDRPNRGKSLLTFPDHYVAIDIETTGFDTRFDEIIEVAAIKYIDSCEVERFQSLIKPENPVGEFIESLTGISHEMLADAPTLETVLPEFRKFIGSELLVGHNVSFDVRFIYDFSRLLNLDVFGNDFVDTLRIAQWLFPDLPDYKLDTVCNRCGVTNVGAHRAVIDCERTHACLTYMRKFAAESDFDIQLAVRKKSYSKHRHFESVTPKDITPSTDQFNLQHPLYGKNIVFTGELSLDRRTAMQMAVDVGAIVKTAISGKTNFLVVGHQDPSVVGPDGFSSKQRKAMALYHSGKANIAIISEKDFMSLLESLQ